jgi:hypothetical protein
MRIDQAAMPTAPTQLSAARDARQFRVKSAAT